MQPNNNLIQYLKLNKRKLFAYFLSFLALFSVGNLVFNNQFVATRLLYCLFLIILIIAGIKGFMYFFSKENRQFIISAAILAVITNLIALYPVLSIDGWPLNNEGLAFKEFLHVGGSPGEGE